MMGEKETKKKRHSALDKQQTPIESIGARPIHVPIVIIAGRSRLRVHVRHIVRFVIPFEGALARALLAGQLAAQLTRFGLGIVRFGDALTRFQAIGQANRPRALAHEAHKLLVAYRLIWLVHRGRAQCRLAITEARITASVVLATFVAESQFAGSGAARA